MLLDLNEQEASQLRRKVEELELANETSKKQIKELQEKVRVLTASTKDKPSAGRPLATNESSEKLRNKDKEISGLKIKLNEKERAIDKLTTELKNSKSATPTGSDALVLRNKVQTLEKEIETMTNENKMLALRAAKVDSRDGKAGDLEKQLLAAIAEIGDLFTLRRSLFNL